MRGGSPCVCVCVRTRSPRGAAVGGGWCPGRGWGCGGTRGPWGCGGAAGDLRGRVVPRRVRAGAGPGLGAAGVPGCLRVCVCERGGAVPCLFRGWGGPWRGWGGCCPCGGCPYAGVGSPPRRPVGAGPGARRHLGSHQVPGAGTGGGGGAAPSPSPPRRAEAASPRGELRTRPQGLPSVPGAGEGGGAVSAPPPLARGAPARGWLCRGLPALRPRDLKPSGAGLFRLTPEPPGKPKSPGALPAPRLLPLALSQPAVGGGAGVPGTGAPEALTHAPPGGRRAVWVSHRVPAARSPRDLGFKGKGCICRAR